MDFIDHRSTAQFTFLTSATDEKIRINTSGDLLVGISTPFDTSGITLDATGALGVDGHITVATGATYDIGTATNKFRDLYLSGDINVAGVSTSGDLTVGGSLSVTTDATVTGSLTVSTDATITNDLTVSNDATVSGDLTVSTNAVIAGDLTVNGTTTTINTETLDVKDKNITLNYGGDTTSADGAGITIEDAVSAGTDATILWDGSTDTFDFSHAIDVTGTIYGDNNLSIQNSSAYGSIEVGGVSGGFIDIKSPFSDDYDLRLISEGSGGVINVASGELTIQRAGSAKLATTSTGVSITGDATFADDGKAIFGAGSDLQIYHDGTHSRIDDAGTGALVLRADYGLFVQKYSDNTAMLYARTDGAVELFHNGSEKLATSSTGIDVTGNATFADNGKAVFGAGSDLQIYHDGSNSYIENTAPFMLIESGTIVLRNTAGTEDYAKFNENSDVKLYFDNAQKFATTSTGIDVTGTAVTDGLTVDTAIDTSTASFRATTNSTTIGQKIGSLDFFNGTTNAAGTLEVRRASGGNAYSDIALMASANGNRSNQLLLSTNGDISFYEDTGTTAKLFWDASAESLGIGTSSPASGLELEGVGNATNVTLDNTTATTGRSYSIRSGNTGNLDFYDNDATTARLTINSSGFAGLGTNAPAAKLDIVDTSADVQMRVYKNDGTKNTRVTVTADDSGAKIHYRDADNAGALRFNNNLGEVMRITADTTRVGIGTSDPERLLHLAGNPAILLLEDTDGGTDDKRAQLQVDSGVFEINSRNDDNSSRVDNIFVADLGSGNIGVGTVSPPAKVSVFGTGAGNATVQIEGEGGADPYINFLANNAQHWSLGIDDSDSDKFKLSEHSALGTNDYLVVDVTGRVGIGTVSPTSRMTVKATGSSFADASLVLENYNTTDRTYLAHTGGKFYLSNDGSTTHMLVDASGNVGIGTSSPSDLMTIQSPASGGGNGITIKRNDNGTDQRVGAISFGNTVDSDLAQITVQTSTGNNGDGNLLFHTQPNGGSSTERLRIDSSGRVGIGTSSPGSLLELEATGSTVFDGTDTNGQAADGTTLAIQNLSDTNNTFSQILFRNRNASKAVSRIASLTDSTGTEMAFVVENNGSPAEVLRLEKTGNVGIGTSSPSSVLHLSTSNDPKITLTDTGFGASADITGSNGNLRLNSQTATIFDMADSEVARFDTSGNFLVGKTNNSLTNDGTVIRQGGEIIVTNTNDIVANFNRTGTDGAIVYYYKDGSAVGSIGSNSGYLYVGGTAGDDAFLSFGANGVRPSTSAGAARDAAIDLGGSTNRFKNLYLSGSALIKGSVPRVTLTDTDGTNTIGDIRQLSDAIVIKSRNGTSNGVIKFNGDNGTTETEYARLDASGNLLVGTTSYNNDNAGIGLGASNFFYATRDGNLVGSFNRLTSDGSILDFRKDSTTVGSIGSLSGTQIVIDSGGNRSGVRFEDNGLLPRKNSAMADGTVTLGNPSYRFSHLYLSGVVNASQMTTSSADLSLSCTSASHDVLITATRNQRLSAGGSERMRLDSSGNILLGKTSADNTTQGVRFVAGSGFLSIVRSNDNLVVLNRIDGDGTIMEFRTNGTTRGSISISGSTTSYNTTSDERLKQNIEDADDAGAIVDAIQVRKFDWIDGGEHQRYGMVAQELGTVAPEAVTVPDDAEEMQSVDYSKLVPMLVKEIQSLRARVAQLEGEN